MGILIDYFILVTGLMNSGKSTLIAEYLHSHDSVPFTPPPVTVTYKGLNFEFIDSVFAIENGERRYNFYELDAPTISKWFQFVEVADAVVIVYNHDPKIQYGSHEDLAKSVFSHIEKTTPVIFVINNFDDLEEAKESLYQNYKLDNYDGRNVLVTSVKKGDAFFDNNFGNRVKLELNDLENMINTIIRSLK